MKCTKCPMKHTCKEPDRKNGQCCIGDANVEEICAWVCEEPIKQMCFLLVDANNGAIAITEELEDQDEYPYTDCFARLRMGCTDYCEDYYPCKKASFPQKGVVILEEW